MANGDKKTSPDENRWWVDQGQSTEQTKSQERQAPIVGASFFRSVEGYNQEQAHDNLIEVNTKLIDQAHPLPGEWAYLPLTKQRSPVKEIDKIKRALPLPGDVYGVLVDAGLSLRAIVTGTPMNERILEFNFIDDASFDCWVQGEWICEEVFDNKQQLLQHAAALLQRYLKKDVMTKDSFFSTPHASGTLPPARTDW